jgi:hypothetical protein
MDPNTPQFFSQVRRRLGGNNLELDGHNWKMEGAHPSGVEPETF